MTVIAVALVPVTLTLSFWPLVAFWCACVALYGSTVLLLDVSRVQRCLVAALVLAFVAVTVTTLRAKPVRPRPAIVVIPCDPGCQACRDAGWPDSICMWLRK